MRLPLLATRKFAVTVSSVSTATSINMLTILAQASQNATQLSVQVETDQATAQIERELKHKIAALPNTADDTLVKVSQAQLKRLQKTFSTISTRSGQFGTNGNIFTDINKQLAALQTEITSGDSANFDKTLSVAHTDIGNLVIIPPTAPFQPDQVLQIKTNGLAINNSASYDLSTPAGQTAAKADVNNAQLYINQLLGITTSNQVVASSLATGLSNQINFLNQTLQQTLSTSQLDVLSKTAQLTQLAHNQEHLIQLALGNTTQLSSALAKMATITDPPKSPFAALTSAVGATADSITPSQVSSAVLSILA
jgi:hypothetical protein